VADLGAPPAATALPEVVAGAAEVVQLVAVGEPAGVGAVEVLGPLETPEMAATVEILAQARPMPAFRLLAAQTIR